MYHFKMAKMVPTYQTTNLPTNLPTYKYQPTNYPARDFLCIKKFVQTKTFARFSSKTGKSYPKCGVFIGRDSHVLIGRDGHETLPWLSNNHPTPIYQPTNLPSPPTYISVYRQKQEVFCKATQKYTVFPRIVSHVTLNETKRIWKIHFSKKTRDI